MLNSMQLENITEQLNFNFTKMVLQEKQVEFLTMLKQLSEIIKLRKIDELLIDEVLYHRAYTSTQKPNLERLRQRWYGERDNEIF